MRRSVSVVGVVALVGILAAVAQTGQGQPNWVMPVPVQIQPTRPLPAERQFVAWIPPGTYSAIVLNSSGDVRRWAVSLVNRAVNVPIVVPAGGNVVMPFKDGWTVAAADETRIVSRLVPFDDATLYNKVGERAGFVLSAWGIGANGPVPFVYQEVGP